MPRLQLELPTIQNWNCHNCSGCCREHGIFITETEKRRIESQNWVQSGCIAANTPTILLEKSLLGQPVYRLAQQADGACVFLDEQGLCRIHGKFGEAAKPLACRIYPYAFHPKGGGVTVSLRFSCPSVTQNLGKSITRQAQEIREIAELVVPKNRSMSPPPVLVEKTQLNWKETLEIVQRLDASMADPSVSITLKLLRTLFWLNLVQQTNYQKIRGDRLSELLELLTEAAPAEVPELPEAVPPSRLAKMQFRLMAGRYSRKDTFASMDKSWKGRVKLLSAAMSLCFGSGEIPELLPGRKGHRFAELEGEFGDLPEASEELLTRYFRIKIQGMHFCGPAFYNSSLIAGFHTLALVFPITMWIARWRAVSQQRAHVTHEDVREALQIVDHQHGYSDACGTWGSKMSVSTIAATGNLQRLILRYTK